MPHYLAEVFSLSLFMVKKLVLGGYAGATLVLAPGTAVVAGPGWTGRLGRQVASHQLVVLLVGSCGQGGLALEAGGQV